MKKTKPCRHNLKLLCNFAKEIIHNYVKSNIAENLWHADKGPNSKGLMLFISLLQIISWAEGKYDSAQMSEMFLNVLSNSDSLCEYTLC